jgi:monoamine oxidase
MARTPLFRSIRQLFKQTRFTNLNPDFKNWLEEYKDADGISRRELLESAVKLGLSMSVLGSIKSQGSSIPPSTQSLGRVAILGAGFSGLSAAYILSKSKDRYSSLEIFEASNRIGGRVYTLDGFNSEGMFAELGAECIDTGHLAIRDLCAELGITIDDIRASETGDTVFHFDHTNRTEADVIHALGPLLPFLEKDIQDLLDPDGEFTCHAKALDRLSLKEYLDKIQVLSGCDKWIIKLLEISTAGEMGLDAEDQSCINLLQVFSTDLAKGFNPFGVGHETSRIHGGNSRLSEALEKVLTKNQIPLYKRQSVTKIEFTKNLFVLEFNRTHKIRFDSVICTLPFKILRTIPGYETVVSNSKTIKSIQEMGYGNNLKVVYSFKQPFWREPFPGFSHGGNGNIFCDSLSQCFWETSRAQTGKQGILTNYLTGKSALSLKGHLHFRQKESFSLLTSIFGKKPDTYFNRRLALFNWPEYSYSRASYSCPKMGQATELFPNAPPPEQGNRWLFAGEHTSPEFFGFMNGAIESGIGAAEKLLW